MTEKNEFTSEFIAAELLKASRATPRPWLSSEHTESNHIGHVDAFHPYCKAYGSVAVTHDISNATFIASAANHYPDALREIQRLREALNTIANNRWSGMSDCMQDIAKKALEGGE